MSASFMAGTREYPYHVSVGAVLANHKKEICAHYFDKLEFEGKILEDFYILMRETPEENETLIDTLNRGLQEEFGAKAEPVHFIGSLTDQLNLEYNQEKTTLYFLCKLTSQDIAKRAKEDPESSSEIVWRSADELILKMQAQSDRIKLASLNESSILERAKQYLNSL